MSNWISKLEQFRAQGSAVAVVTVTSCTGSTPRDPGAKMLVLQSGEIHGTIGGGHLEELAIAEARKCLAEGVARTIRYPLGAKAGQCCGGVVDLFFEVVNAGPKLYVFGAGHVGQALCRVLEGTPFIVHAIDEREEWIGSRKLPEGVIRHAVEWDEFVQQAKWDERVYVAVMTHRHDTDQAIVEALLERPLKFLGLIGSQAKWERFKQRMDARGIGEARWARVKCPIGLDIGGKSPQEVAISIAGEFLKIHYGR